MMVVRDLDRILRAISPAMSSDETRPHMNAVFVDVKMSRVVATDGHQLAMVDDVEFEGKMANSFLIADADVDAMCSAFRKEEPTDIEVHEDRFVCGNASVPRTRVDPNLRFSPYDVILPRDGLVAVEKIGVNIDYLIGAQAGFDCYKFRVKTYKGKSETIRFFPTMVFRGNLAPIVLRADAKSYYDHASKTMKVAACPLTWLVMPMRI